jgi:type III pantothenate kinase
MLLAVDSGNTNIVFAVFDGETLRAEWRAATDANRTADQYGALLLQLMAREGIDAAAIDAMVIANVVPQSLFNLNQLAQRYFRLQPLIVGAPGVELGIKNMTERPEQVGADRLVNGLAGHRRYGGPLIVTDFGTATTFDVIDREGSYRGGIIAPGVNLSMQALDAAAAHLPRVAVGRPQKVIGSDTVSAMRSGIYFGYLGLIEGLVQRIKDEFGAKMTVVATGGLAPLFASATPAIDHLDRDLTMRGLLEVYRLNRRL